MDENAVIQQAEALINSLQQPATGVAEPGAGGQGEPQSPYGEIQPEQFYGALERVSGGLLKTEQDFGRIKAEFEQSKALREQLAQLEAERHKFTSLNPLATKINEILSAGGTMKEVNHFISVQSLDVDALDERSAYAKQMSFKYPGLSSEEIDALVNDEFGIDAENPNPVSLAKLKKAGLDAKAYLRDMKVAAENPQAVQRRQQEEAHLTTLKTGWGKVIEHLAGTLANKTEHDFDGEKYAFEYKYSPEAIQYAKAVVMEQAVMARLPLDQNSATNVIDVMHRMATAYDAQNMTKAMLSDAWAKAKLAALKSTAGPQPQSPKPGERIVPNNKPGERIKPSSLLG